MICIQGYVYKQAGAWYYRWVIARKTSSIKKCLTHSSVCPHAPNRKGAFTEPCFPPLFIKTNNMWSIFQFKYQLFFKELKPIHIISIKVLHEPSSAKAVQWTSFCQSVRFYVYYPLFVCKESVWARPEWQNNNIQLQLQKSLWVLTDSHIISVVATEILMRHICLIIVPKSQVSVLLHCALRKAMSITLTLLTQNNPLFLSRGHPRPFVVQKDLWATRRGAEEAATAAAGLSRPFRGAQQLFFLSAILSSRFAPEKLPETRGWSVHQQTATLSLRVSVTPGP